jgi:hypothetical protein
MLARNTRAAAAHIDPATADVTWTYSEMADPYGVLDLPEGCSPVEPTYFAMAPGTEVWVWLGDLPEVVQFALWNKISNVLFDAEGKLLPPPEPEVPKSLRVALRALVRRGLIEEVIRPNGELAYRAISEEYTPGGLDASDFLPDAGEQ